MQDGKLLWLLTPIILFAILTIVFFTNKYSIPNGWRTTTIYIKDIETYGTGYIFTLTYTYHQQDDLKETIEQRASDQRKPKSDQRIKAIYYQQKPILFELLEPMLYES